MMMIVATTIGMLVAGYLLGSIPFGLLLTRFAGLGDIRAIGSGNIGATNVLRTGRKGIAAATLLADGLKGTAAALIGLAIGPEYGIVAGFGAFIGHLYPVWLGFRGGKGVATYIGVLAALAWPVGLLFGAVWLATAYFSRYSSASALLASLVAALALFFVTGLNTALVFAVMTAILWWRHHGNIRRLLAGMESRIGQR